jgi:hypothetical protein
MKKKVYFVDIDDTICSHPSHIDLDGNRTYENAVPIKENIDKVNVLFDQGHRIVYWTARGSRSGIDWRELTQKQLNEWGAKHHDLRLDKPYYDKFIEDRSMFIEDLRVYISHRGNINGVDERRENSPEYINEAIEAGYDVEVDVRLDHEGKYWLGHDYPQYEIDKKWLTDRNSFLWIHAKNVQALIALKDDHRVFAHNCDDQTIISNSDYIWTHDLSNITRRSVIPLLDKSHDIKVYANTEFYGVCSDYVEYYKTEFVRRFPDRRI